jgi:hypothetical protein
VNKFFIFAILLIGCNPVKQVLRDKAKLDKVAEVVVRSGYCANDTTTVTEWRDSVVYKDTGSIKIEKIPCEDFKVDTGDVEVSVSSGVLKIKRKDSLVYRTKTVTNTVVDNARVDILIKDIDKAQSEISALKQTIKGKNKTIFKLWAIIAILGIALFRKPLLRIIGL